MQINNKKKIKTIFLFYLAIKHLLGRRCEQRDSQAAWLQPFSESQKLPKSWLQKNQGTETLPPYIKHISLKSIKGTREGQMEQESCLGALDSFFKFEVKLGLNYQNTKPKTDPPS